MNRPEFCSSADEKLLAEIISTEGAGERLDQYLVSRLADSSRNQIRRLIDEGLALLNGQKVKAGYRLKTGDQLFLRRRAEETEKLEAEELPLKIIYEDEDLLVIHKSRGVVVHPAPGHKSGTIVNALLARPGRQLSDLGGTERPGIVHRLDKDTSGLLLVAKNNQMHRLLSEMLSKHEINREYRAFVYGGPEAASGTIDAPIGRDPKQRQRMAVVGGGKAARTHFRVLRRYAKITELELSLESGRTHQIRVHMKSIGCPVVADPLYAPGRESYGLDGQALHAFRLSFRDPRNGAERVFTAEEPPCFEKLREALSAEHGSLSQMI